MWRNYLRTGIRMLLNRKLFSGINIIGLTAGITVFMFIVMYVQHEFSYDKFVEKRTQIYRLDLDDWGILGTAYGPDVEQNFPEVRKAIRINNIQNTTPYIQRNGQFEQLEGVIHADTAIFDLFNFTFVQGNAKQAFAKPFSLVLTQSEAERLYGKENPIGKTLTFDKKFSYTISAVIKDPVTFHLPFKAMASFESLAEMRGDKERFLTSYGSWNYPTYLLVEQDADIAALEEKLNLHFKKRFRENFNSDLNRNFHLRPLSNIYFSNDCKYEIGVKHGNKSFLIILLSIAILILVIACINFVNMSTAMAARRAKDIGIRKIVGAKRRQLIAQILLESFILVLVSFALAALCIELFMPSFNFLTHSNLTPNWYAQPLFIGISFGIIAILAFAAGGYPAFYLTQVEARRVVKGEVTNGKAGTNFQKGLICFQFLVSALLLIGTFALYQQLHYMRNKSLGFDKDKIAWFRGTGKIMEQKEAVKNELLAHPAIEAVSFAQSPAGFVKWQESWNYKNNKLQFTFQPTDPDYDDVMGFEMAKGRFFDWQNPSHQGGVFVINETMMNALNLQDNVGEYIQVGRGEPVLLLGVVKDFHFNSVVSPIGPLAMEWRPNAHVVHIRMKGAGTIEVPEYVEEVYHKFETEYPFNFHFQRATFDGLYAQQERYLQLFVYAAAIAIIISIMGLFALSLFITQQRTKEIGVRKANGAQTPEILRMFLGRFYKLVIVANLIAWPIAGYGLQQWLSAFPYRIDFPWLYLGVVLLVTLFIATFTVGYQTLRAANSNPATALHHE